MLRELAVSDYGLCIFNTASLQSFLKGKTRSKKILNYFQKNKDVYLEAISKGAWLPILPIDSIDYLIKISNLDEGYDTSWIKVNETQGFNIDVEDNNGLWITSKGVFYTWDYREFDATSNSLSYQTLDGFTCYYAFRITIPKGKYQLNIAGYKQQRTDKSIQAGYLFDLIPVKEFGQTLDPRDDDKYYFKIR